MLHGVLWGGPLRSFVACALIKMYDMCTSRLVLHATTNPAASAIVRFDGMCHDIYSEKDLLLMKKSNVIDWIIRLVKGAFVGTGFILPGVSGGALAAIFGLYEKIITFIAHITKDFKENFFSSSL